MSKLPESFINEGLKLSKNMTVFGINIDDLSFEEIIATIGHTYKHDKNKYFDTEIPCHWIFKSIDCGYEGKKFLQCNKSFVDCKDRGRQEKFSGFLKDKSI